MNDFSKSLCHYGVIGMKWGLRRYQPYPKGYTGSGKYTGSKGKLTKEYKREFKADNKALRKAVREASGLGRAMSEANRDLDRSNKRLGLANQRLERESDRSFRTRNNEKTVSRIGKEASLNKETAKRLTERYNSAEKKAEKMISDIRKKYGKDTVRDLIYSEDENGRRVINEDVANGAQKAAYALLLAGEFTLNMLFGPPNVNSAPLSDWVAPKTRDSLGRDMLYRTRREVQRDMKKGG